MYSHSEYYSSLIRDRDGDLSAVVMQGRRQLLAVTVRKAGSKNDRHRTKTRGVELLFTPRCRHVDLDKFLDVFGIGLEFDLEAFLQTRGHV